MTCVSRTAGISRVNRELTIFFFNLNEIFEFKKCFNSQCHYHTDYHTIAVFLSAFFFHDVWGEKCRIFGVGEGNSDSVFIEKIIFLDFCFFLKRLYKFETRFFMFDRY